MKKIWSVWAVCIIGMGMLTACSTVSYPEYPVPQAEEIVGFKETASNAPQSWSACFYQHKRFDEIASWLSAMDLNGALRYSAGQDYAMGFMIMLLRTYPKETAMLESQCTTLTANAERLFAYSLFYASTPESRAQLRQLTYRNSEHSDLLGRHVPNFKIEKIRNVSQLNYMFGFFHVTGKGEYLALILNCLSEKNYRRSGNPTLKMLNDIAIPQLADNFSRDSMLRTYCEGVVDTLPEDVAYDLSLSLKSATMESAMNRASNTTSPAQDADRPRFIPLDVSTQSVSPQSAIR